MEPYLMSIIWAAVFVGAIIIEAASVEMVAIWFMPGALASFVLSFFGVYEWVQCIVFVTITAVLLIVAMPIFRKYIKKHIGQAKTDIDLLVGRFATVEEKIDCSLDLGSVKINGQLWSARMTDPECVVEVGEHVVVESVEGSRLVCRKVDKK